VVPSKNRDGALRNAKSGGKNADQFDVCRPINWGRLDTHQQRLSAHTR
jgi:hypothetical protein